MFNLFRLPGAGLARAFSSSAARSTDVAKLVLVGRLGRDPEVRMTKSEKEYISYTVATNNFPPPPPNPDGTRPETKTTWHRIVSYSPNNFLRNLQKGSHVYVEANYEVREPDPRAELGTFQAQRQIFLRHESIRLLRGPSQSTEENTEERKSEEKNTEESL